MKTLTITEASRRGISDLVASAEAGRSIPISRHGRVVAEIVSSQEMEKLRQDQELLRDAALVITRFTTDSGVRTDLDQAMQAFGLDRAELESAIGSYFSRRTPRACGVDLRTRDQEPGGAPDCRLLAG